MEQTNYQLSDFLDFDLAFTDSELLWKCGEVDELKEENGDFEIRGPFQKQKPMNDTTPDLDVAPVVDELRLFAYNNKILRITFGDFKKDLLESEVLHFHKSVKQSTSVFQETSDAYLICNEAGELPARLNRVSFDLDHWRDFNEMREVHNQARVLDALAKTINWTLKN